MSSPSAILQFSGALQLINSSGAVGDVEVGAAYSHHYSWTEKLGITGGVCASVYVSAGECRSEWQDPSPTVADHTHWTGPRKGWAPKILACPVLPLLLCFLQNVKLFVLLLEIHFLSSSVFPVFPDFARSSSLLCSVSVLVNLFFQILLFSAQHLLQ